MSDNPGDELLKLFRKVGVASSADFWDKPEDQATALQVLLDLLNAATRDYAARFPPEHAASRPLDLTNLALTGDENPHKLRAFLQALDSASTPTMLVMVWRLLQGDEIRSVVMQYESGGGFTIEIVLADPATGQFSQYRSGALEDAALLRHFGIMKMGDRALFDGFYALTG